MKTDFNYNLYPGFTVSYNQVENILQINIFTNPLIF